MLPDLLQRLPSAEAEKKIDIALALAAIDARNTRVASTVGPILVAALRPQTTETKPDEAVLKAIAAIGEPVVDEIFKALEAADGIGALNADNRKALFMALQRLGRQAYSEANIYLLRKYQQKERYRDVQEAAGKALAAVLRPER